jgi:hypothetical protein
MCRCGSRNSGTSPGGIPLRSSQLAFGNTTTAIKIRDSKMARDLIQLIRDRQSDLLFHHSTRMHLFGALTGQRKGLQYDVCPACPPATCDQRKMSP